MAITNNAAAARTAAKNTAVSLQPGLTDANIVFRDLDAPTSSTCVPGHRMSITITYNLSTMTGIAGPFPMTGRGAMLCGG